MLTGLGATAGHRAALSELDLTHCAIPVPGKLLKSLKWLRHSTPIRVATLVLASGVQVGDRNIVHWISQSRLDRKAKELYDIKTDFYAIILVDAEEIASDSHEV